jgi:hypothetical protein
MHGGRLMLPGRVSGLRDGRLHGGLEWLMP